jgi:hypothetical protein
MPDGPLFSADSHYALYARVDEPLRAAGARDED